MCWQNANVKTDLQDFVLENFNVEGTCSGTPREADENKTPAVTERLNFSNPKVHEHVKDNRLSV